MVTGLIKEKVYVEGVVTSDPTRTLSRVIGSRETSPRFSFLLRAESMSAGANRERVYNLRIPIRVIATEKLEFIPGEKVKILGTLIKSEERKVAGLLLAQSGEAISLFRPNLQGALEGLRTKLRVSASMIGGDAASLLPGLVIGDTSLQTPEFSKLMIGAGLSHLTAVSGANFAIISAFIFALLGQFITNRRIQLVVTFLVLIIYVILARPTPSVVRAATMVAIYLFAKFSGKRTLAANTLAIAVSAILLINPYLAFEPGFILSVLATTGLIFLAPKIAERIPGPRVIGELISIPTSATLLCAPYILFMSGRLNLGTIVLNVLVAPVIPLVTIFAFIAMLLIYPFEFLATLMLKAANIGTNWIVAMAQLSDLFPNIMTSSLTVLLLAGSFLVIRAFGANRYLLVLLILLSFSVNQRVIFPGNEWRIGQCDVGQGDALLINLGNSSAILFDAGPDVSKLQQCLREFKVKKLPLVVVSHAHADHYAGLKGLSGVTIGEIWSNRAEVDFTARSVREVRAGFEARIGEVELKILWPQTGAELFQSISGDGSPENNRSVVSLVEVEGRRLLVTGDIEPGSQAEILEALPELDFIKVPHHGSRFQNLDLFRGAELFLISVGKNSYGHPDSGLIAHLEELGQVFRTDLDGAIAIRWNGTDSAKRFSVRRLGKEWWRIAWH